MIDFETIATVKREGTARVLITALRAHGFSPRDIADGGFPGVSSGLTGSGIPITVPASEAAEARPLAEALLGDMRD
ncbi:hypothetical protein [Pelagibacterium montanilacus]|uniref:hypothetical protein n=1 Tax=Pelagibacterium montanilacus TaxID=2185280 RepID=UPI000F8E58C1|nr:hypothetical protein [Pelagibacterium montanilacus]